MTMLGHFVVWYMVAGLGNMCLCSWIHDQAVRVDNMPPDPDFEFTAWVALFLWPLTLPVVLYALITTPPGRRK